MIINPYRFATGAGADVSLPNYWWDLDDDNTWSNDGELSALALVEADGSVTTTSSTIGSGGSRTVADFTLGEQLTDTTATWDGTGENVSFACWVNVNTLDDTGAGVMVWRGSDKVMQIQLNNIDATTAHVVGAVWDASADVAFTSTSSTALTEGEWTHVAATWDGTTLRIYRNAVEVGSATNASVGALTSGTGTFQLGRRESNSNYDLDGQMAFAGIWDVALSVSELEALYNSGDGASYSQISWI